MRFWEVHERLGYFKTVYDYSGGTHALRDGEEGVVVETCWVLHLLCVTWRKQQRPGIAANDNTMHVPATRSSADLTKPNHTPTRHTRAKDRMILQMATFSAA